jgi:multidrug efflux pump subunit AcrA (membrane-fusion protein)
MAKHERDGDTARWLEAQRRAAEREEQERAYNESLRADQEAERVAAEAEAEAAAEARLQEALRASRAAAEAEAERREAEARAAAERAAAERRAAARRAAAGLAPEPAAGTPGTTCIRVRLPNGSSLTRRFAVHSMMRDLWSWLEDVEAAIEWTAEEGWTLAPPPSNAIDGGLYPTEETLAELDLINVTLSVIAA